MNNMIKLSIILVSYNTREILKKCLEYVKQYSDPSSMEVIIVDNDSKDKSAEMVKEFFPEYQLIVSKTNLGFAGGNNLALKVAKGQYLLLLNPDAYLQPDTITKTIQYMDENSDCGILGVKLLGEDGQRQPCARDIPTPWSKFLVLSGIASKFPNSKVFGGPDRNWWDHSKISEVGWVVGAYFLMRKELIETLGYLDERYFVYYEELDYCLNAKRKGWKVIFYPHTFVIHLGGKSALASEKKVSRTGTQVLNFRIESELRYHYKNYGYINMILMCGLEWVWMKMIYYKNIIFKDSNSEIKKENASNIIQLINQNLKQKKYKILK